LKVTEGKNKASVGGLDKSTVHVEYEKGTVDVILKQRSKPVGASTTTAKKKAPVKKNKVVRPEFVKFLEGTSVGQALSGKIAHKYQMDMPPRGSADGIFICILGCTAQAKLDATKKQFEDKLRWGEELKLIVASVEVAKGRLVVELADAEAFVAGREGRIKMSALQEGSVHVGHVAIRLPFGVFVDLHSEG